MMAQGMQAMTLLDNIYGIEVLEEAGVNYGVAPVPVVREGDAGWVSSWTDSFGVFSDSAHPEAAMKFIAFLSTEGNRLRTEVGGLPLNMALAEAMDWAGDNPGRQELLQTMTLARAGIFVPSFWDVIDPIWDAWDMTVEGEVTAEEAFAEAAEYMQENLDQAWETWNSLE
jgi:ABC-type glycerol-3-phosphate transport system substrate-binding protein